MKNGVLVVAPGRKTRGGITTVINSYERTPIWEKWNCRWIETYRDTSKYIKIWYFLRAFLLYLIVLPKSKIVHIHFSWSTSALRKFPFFVCAKILGKKVIVHLHSGDDMIVNAKHQFIYKTFFLHADNTIVLAESIKNKLLSKYIFKKVCVVYNPCPEVEADIKIVRKKEILFAGTLYQIKGYSDLIEAFSLIAEKFPDWKIVFAGNGEIDKGIFLAKKLQIENQLVFKGWVLESGKEKLFRESSFLCLPSYTEGFPMAVLDAWAYGLPVIATPVGGLPDVMVNGFNGLVFESGDVVGLSKCLAELMGNTLLREHISQNSIKLAATIFNIENIVNQIEIIYLELIDYFD